MKKKLNKNMEIFNYLNLVNPRLGRLYRLSGTHCLPKDFDVNENTIKERILLNEFANENVFPPFVYEEKNDFKKHIKNSVKNIKKIQKNAKNPQFLSKFSSEFCKKFDFYLQLRQELSHALLKDFHGQNYDEIDAYRQLYNLDPIFGEFLDGLYDANVNFSALLSGLEGKYLKSYAEKLQAFENEKKKKSAKQKAHQKTAKIAHDLHNKKAKNAEKAAKNAKKLQNQKDVQTVRTQNKQSGIQAKQKQKNVNKEKT